MRQRVGRRLLPKVPSKSAKRVYRPSEQDRKVVETLAGYGVPPDEIRQVVVNTTNGKALSTAALMRHFRQELTRGLAKANAEVAESLFRLAVGQAKVVIDGEVVQDEREPKVTAAIFWAKTRMGWSDGASQEVGRARGGAILAESKVTIYIPENARDPSAARPPGKLPRDSG